MRKVKRVFSHRIQVCKAASNKDAKKDASLTTETDSSVSCSDQPPITEPSDEDSSCCVICWEGELEREVEWVQCSEYVRILYSKHAQPFYEIGHFLGDKSVWRQQKWQAITFMHVTSGEQSIAMQPQLEFLTFDVEI